MFTYQWSDHYLRPLTTAGVCSMIEEDFHRPVLRQLSFINDLLEEEWGMEAVRETTLGLIKLLYNKLGDELQHTFMQESGLVFPRIRRIRQIPIHVEEGHFDSSFLESMQHKHQVIIGITQKIRQLLNNYMPEKDWKEPLKSLANELFLLENKVLHWIHIEQNYLFPEIVGEEERKNTKRH